LLQCKIIVVEYSGVSEALSALIQLQEAQIEHEKSPYPLTLLGMFEADEEQKAFVIDKKEQQKIEDEFDKSDKTVD
jgi:hypothetical protein